MAKNERGEASRGGQQRQHERQSGSQAMQPPQGGRGTGQPMQRGGGGTRSPFAFMRRMMDDMDRLFSEFGMSSMMPRGMSLLEEPFFGSSGGRMLETFSPEMEVFQREGKLVVRADLPGLRREDVRVSFDEGALTIEGERRSEEEKDEGGVYMSERSYGSFQRTIPLPRGVDPSRCDARFESGVLEVTVDLPQQATRRQIDVRGGAAEPQAQQSREAQGQAQAKPGQRAPEAQENGPGASSRH